MKVLPFYVGLVLYQVFAPILGLHDIESSADFIAGATFMTVFALITYRKKGK